MAGDKKMQSFRAGDLQAAKQKAAGRPAQAPAEQQKAAAVTATIGFERIERLLDEEVPGEVGQKLANLLDSLGELEKTQTSAKAKGGAKKARLAVERTIDLLDYLYQIKQGLLQQVAAKKPAAGARAKAGQKEHRNG